MDEKNVIQGTLFPELEETKQQKPQTVNKSISQLESEIEVLKRENTEGSENANLEILNSLKNYHKRNQNMTNNTYTQLYNFMNIQNNFK